MREAERPDWSGRTVVCLASGPSLTPEDVATVRATGWPVVVTNTTFRLAPWADALFAFDASWWRQHDQEVARAFRGRKFTASQNARHFGAESLYGSTWFQHAGNSGASAIALAVAARAARVILLGFDCCPGPAGEKHWHGDHPQGMSNCSSMSKWPGQFDLIAKRARKARVPVLNCSRRTALRCFDLMTLEDALCPQSEAVQA